MNILESLYEEILEKPEDIALQGLLHDYYLDEGRNLLEEQEKLWPNDRCVLPCYGKYCITEIDIMILQYFSSSYKNYIKYPITFVNHYRIPLKDIRKNTCRWLLQTDNQFAGYYIPENIYNLMSYDSLEYGAKVFECTKKASKELSCACLNLLRSHKWSLML